MKIFATQLTQLNNYLPLFPRSSISKKMAPEELNDILLRAILNAWAEQSYLQVWGFEGSTYKDTCEISERIEISEKVYKGG